MSEVYSPMPDEEEHWTRTLFVNHPELFLNGMERHKEIAAREAAQLFKILMGVFQLHPESTKVLDLCCGLGIHSIEFARCGYEVVGFDLSPHCVRRARELANENELDEKRLRFYQGDLRQVANVLSERGETGFNVILSIGNSIGYYGEKEDLEELKELFDLASPGCILILDVVNRNWLIRHCSPKGFSQISRTIQMDAERKLNLETFYVENEWKFFETTTPRSNRSLLLSMKWKLRTYSFDELRELLTRSGWIYLRGFGSLTSLDPLTAESYHMVLISKKKSS